jgi:hypothetical protein
LRPIWRTWTLTPSSIKIGVFRPPARFFSATYSAALPTRRVPKCRPRSGRSW